MNVNDEAPDFTLPDENGKQVSLKDFRGKTVVLFFYPKADTPGWTIEACGFRDAYKKLQKTGAVILGISADSPDKQKKFQGKYDLPYTLLADTDKKVGEAFGVIKEKNMYGNKVMGIERTTFVIGPDGRIAHIFPKVKAEGHAEEVLEYLKTAAWHLVWLTWCRGARWGAPLNPAFGRTERMGPTQARFWLEWANKSATDSNG
jgi:peroxiredoxin Q/BCP